MNNAAGRALVVFTNASSLNGGGKSWFLDELKFFKGDYRIIVYVFDFVDEKVIEEFRSSFTIISLNIAAASSKMAFSLAFWSVYLPLFVKEFFRERVFVKRYWLSSWLNSIRTALTLYKKNIFRTLDDLDRDNTIIYFYWANNATILIPLFRKKGFHKLVARFHGFDLYKERLGGYQPFAKMVLRNLHTALPISEQGRQYLKKTYPGIRFRAEVFYLGTREAGASTPGNDDRLRIVSCSALIELKQVPLIAAAVTRCRFPVEWVHIGEGPEKEKVRSIIDGLPSNANVTCSLLGWKSPDEIPDFYARSHFDVFINASTTEGIPVSIMEAFAAKIPAIAPNVGGIGEIVIDQVTGLLLSPGFGEDDLVNAINYFYNLSREKKTGLGENAFRHFKDNFDMKKNGRRFRDFVDSI